MVVTVRQRLLDVAPSAGLLALGLVELFAGSGFRGPQVANALFLFATCAPLVIRRRRPVLAVAGVFVPLNAWVAAYYTGSHQPPVEPFLAGVVACFALGLHADRRGLRDGVVVLTVTVVAVALSLALGGADVEGAIPVLIWWAAAIGIGRGLHERQALVHLLRDRAARLERDRERDVAEAAFEERARIARELHDVIAHGVSLIVVQAGAERRLLRADQRRTAETLETIESAGREALGELRRLLGVLRARGAERLAPQPSLSTLEELLDDARRAGQEIHARIEGAPIRLPAGLDLTAYRIVQEALTNARKHASGARTEVTVRWLAAELEIRVRDAGPGVVGQVNGAGHGLIGMRERAALYGGSVEAGPAAGGGFEVLARLPIDHGAGR